MIKVNFLAKLKMTWNLKDSISTRKIKYIINTYVVKHPWKVFLNDH